MLFKLYARYLSVQDILLVICPEIKPCMDSLEVDGNLGAVPVHCLAAAGHPAVDGLLTPGGIVGEVLPLVDWGRHVADLIMAPELGTISWVEI